MFKWAKRGPGSYASQCGRFRIRATVSARHRQDGFKWEFADDVVKTTFMVKTLAAGKVEAERRANLALAGIA